MADSEIESESTKKNDYYKKKIEIMNNDYENQTRQKNEELSDIFEEITLENNNLKKDLLLAKEELEEEIEKNIDIKNSIYNFNYFTKTASNELDLKLGKNKNNIKDYTNSAFCDYIKNIKDECNEKLSELNIEQEKNIKNFELMKTALENNIKHIYNETKDQKNINNYFKDIFDQLNIYNNKYNTLLLENYSNKKYNIILFEKLDLAREEIIFLKERIIKEKKLILEKINSISHNNELTHISITQEILNEINNKRNNYFNEQFYFSLQNIKQNFLDFKENEKELNYQNEKLKKELEELKYKFDKINEEKNELIKNAVIYTTKKENSNSNEIYLQNLVNKLRKEKDLLENENNSLIKNNSELNEQINNINNKIKFEISQNKKNSEIIINQKDNLIKELNKKLDNITEINSRDNMTIKSLNEELISLKNQNQEHITNENNLKTETLILKKKLNESNYKTTNNQTNTLETLNNIQKNSSDKKTMKEKLDNNYRNKNNDLNGFKLTSTEKGNEGDDNISIIIKKIYLNHISNEIDNNDEVNMLKEINNKLNQLENGINKNNNNFGNNEFIKVKLVYNEYFDGLERNKNSQLYENILIYLFHLKSQQKIEINKIINNFMEPSEKNNKKMLQILNNLQKELNEYYNKYNQRIKNAIIIDEVEQLISELKNLYETIIDYIIQNFYKYKSDLIGNILPIQIPLEEYHRIINNTSANLANIDANIVNKINEYRSQGNKIENALNILIENVNINLN